MLSTTEDNRPYVYGQEVATCYADLFPGYPADLRMAKDLARFVSNLWSNVLRTVIITLLSTQDTCIIETMM